MRPRLLILLCVCPCFLSIVSAFDASVNPENAQELLAQCSEWIVIAKQVGPIQHEKIDDVAIKDVYEGEFIVQKFIKGKFEDEHFRVHAGWLETAQTFPPANSTAVLYLKPHLHGRDFDLRAFKALPDTKAEERFEADYSNIQKTTERRRQEALDELSAIAPESLKRAKELWPVLLARSKELNENKENDWFKDDLLTIRGLKVLCYPDQTPSWLDNLANNCEEKSREADRAEVVRWIQFHFRRLKSDEELATFSVANHRYTAAICLKFPPTSVWSDTDGTQPMPFGGRRLMVKRHNKDSDDPSKPSIEVFKTIDFLMSAEDPNLFAFIVAQDAQQQKRTLSSDPAPEYKPIFGLLREEWIDGSLKSWLERGADRRLRNTALSVLSELKSAPVWLREWLRQEIKDAAPEGLAELAAPAICIHDPELLLSLWEEIIARKGSEREFLGWLQYRRVYIPKLATFAIRRWIEERSAVRVDSCLICYKNYLTSYIRTLDPKAQEFAEPVAAADWLNKAFPGSTAGPSPEK